MKKTVLFPGTFDPFTKGHYALLSQGLILFDEVVLAIGHNGQKSKPFFELEKRLFFLESVAREFNGKVRVLSYEGTTIDCCKKENIQFLLRGLRNSHDFVTEQQLLFANDFLAPEIQTVFLALPAVDQWISASMVRELLIYKKDVKKLLPQVLWPYF